MLSKPGGKSPRNGSNKDSLMLKHQDISVCLSLKRASLAHHPVAQAGRDLCPRLSFGKEAGWTPHLQHYCYKHQFCGSRSISIPAWDSSPLTLAYRWRPNCTNTIPSELLPQTHIYFSSFTFARGTFCFFPNSKYLPYFYSVGRKDLSIAIMPKSKSTPGSFGPRWYILVIRLCGEWKRNTKSLMQGWLPQCHFSL